MNQDVGARSLMVAALGWNTDRLVQISVAGEVAPAMLPGRLGGSSFLPGHDGRSHLVPPWGGVTRNVRLGDPARGWAAERVEPGASIYNRDHAANQALLFLACIGNEATVMAGGAQGARGVVTGKHGRFAETVMVQFDQDVLPKLAVGDRVLVVAWGTGLALAECPEVHMKSISPPVATALVTTVRDGVAQVPVRAIVPPELAGAGLGLSSDAGSLSIQTADHRRLEEHGLTDLHLGDLVAFRDLDCRWTNCYRRGAWSVAVVSAGDSVQAGYGVVTTIVITTPDGRLSPHLDPAANISKYLPIHPSR
jgi:hypothetical protein